MRPKRYLVSGCCLEIMRIFFWKMCNTKECVELKNDILQFKIPFWKMCNAKECIELELNLSHKMTSSNIPLKM